MRFKLVLSAERSHAIIPVNYSYPLSAAIYRIIAKGDTQYASFLHETGYGKGFKFFTFSQVNCPFRIAGDRLVLLSNEMHFQIAFHLPQAAAHFVKGLFQSERVDIADKKSSAGFNIKTVESLSDPLALRKDEEILHLTLSPLSPVVSGRKNEKGNYDFISPDNPLFTGNLIHNWRNKIAACYDANRAEKALLMAEVNAVSQPFKSRLMTIKAGTPQETKIRGWLNLGLRVTAEKRFIDLLLNAGAGLYNGVGCRMMEEKRGEE